VVPIGILCLLIVIQDFGTAALIGVGTQLTAAVQNAPQICESLVRGGEERNALML